MARVFRFVDIVGCELHTISDPEDKLPLAQTRQVISIELSMMLEQSVSPERTGSSAPTAYIVRVSEVPAAMGLPFPALLGFVSVSYQGCNQQTYAKIVESRSYLVQKNQEQISSILLSIVVAVLIWDAVILLLTKLAQRESKSQ